MHAVLFGSLALLAGPGWAQLRADPSAWGAGRNGIKLHSEEVVDLRTTEQAPIDPYAYKRGLFSAMGLYEYKPMGAAPGQYTRPHYALGLHSDLMRDALSLTGLEAESCIAPMVRLRARQTTVTGSNGVSLTLLARCTFQ
ncbi:MAG TPA: hypothetical protein VFN64_10925 [Burkholderiaceae bacterium]|nr:hypothetical protein [Burkholderiaceae bacterium]